MSESSRQPALFKFTPCTLRKQGRVSTGTGVISLPPGGGGKGKEGKEGGGDEKKNGGKDDDDKVKFPTVEKNRTKPYKNTGGGGGGKSSLSSTPTKKRGGGKGHHAPPPPICPFRLPTEEEEEEEEVGRYREDQSNLLEKGGKEDGKDENDKGSGDGETKAVISTLREFVSAKGLKIGHKEELLEADMEEEWDMPSFFSKSVRECIAWMREEGGDIFWTEFKSRLDTRPTEPKEWTNVDWMFPVQQAAVSTAQQFKGRLMAIEEVTKQATEDETVVEEEDNGVIKFLRRVFAGLILGSDKKKDIPVAKLYEVFENFYYYGVRVMVGACSKNSNEEPMEQDDGLNKPLDSCKWCEHVDCQCKPLAEGFELANRSLHALGLMNELGGPRLYAVINKEIEKRIDVLKVMVSHVAELQKWLSGFAKVWYTLLYVQPKGSYDQDPPEEFSQELSQLLYYEYGLAIIRGLFNVILEFPESQALLDDLKLCMKAVNLRKTVVSHLRWEIERRLLNPGVSTSSVLEFYITLVRALKYIDPTGILVQLVTPPVREYLKHRDETVRVILISLTEETGELSEELERNPIAPDKDATLTLQNYHLWKPDPIDVPKDRQNLRRSDLIDTVVSIYGSQSVFIDEYRALLADRLLKFPNQSALNREIKCLELLKLRFGEADLQKCEVMLKDVADSQRLINRVYDDPSSVLAAEVSKAIKVLGLIVSAQFWPNFKNGETSLTLPEPVEEALTKYSKAFQLVKGNRTLEWARHVGNVQLEIEIGGTTVEFNVNPTQASIIWHFQEQKTWKIEELAKKIGTSNSYLNNRIGFWVSQGVLLRIGSETYTLAESLNQHGESKKSLVSTKYFEEADGDSPMASASSQRDTELQTFWTYIVGMLTNLESLPLSRIHSMLKLFATVECSSDELQKFLDDKVSQNLLVYSSAQYQLPK